LDLTKLRLAYPVRYSKQARVASTVYESGKQHYRDLWGRDRIAVVASVKNDRWGIPYLWKFLSDNRGIPFYIEPRFDRVSLGQGDGVKTDFVAERAPASSSASPVVYVDRIETSSGVVFNAGTATVSFSVAPSPGAEINLTYNPILLVEFPDWQFAYEQGTESSSMANLVFSEVFA